MSIIIYARKHTLFWFLTVQLYRGEKYLFIYSSYKKILFLKINRKSLTYSLVHQSTREVATKQPCALATNSFFQALIFENVFEPVKSNSLSLKYIVTRRKWQRYLKGYEGGGVRRKSIIV